jgi:hypothetical protein
MVVLKLYCRKLISIKDRWYKLFSKIIKKNNWSPFHIDKMNNFNHADVNFSLNFSTKLADKVTKICMDIYRKLEKSNVLNIIEGLKIPNILEICYLYNLLWKYVKQDVFVKHKCSWERQIPLTAMPTLEVKNKDQCHKDKPVGTHWKDLSLKNSCEISKS